MYCIHAIVVAIYVIVVVSRAERVFCPPNYFVPNYNRSVRGYRTALLFEIHGKVFVSQGDSPVYWTEYFNGAALSRNIYNHVGILAIDRIYISVFYNQSLFPDRPPTVEDIYPPSDYCVSDWNKLGVIGWRPVPFGGPISTWPLNAKGKPSLDKNLYKSYRGSNVIYDEIKNHTDFIFLMDVDEFLFPVNFNTSTSGYTWCRQKQPPLISKILEQILITATSSKLESYEVVKNSARDGDVLSNTAACLMGYSNSHWKSGCTGIESIYFPSYIWIREKNFFGGIPKTRSKFPASYSQFLRDQDVEGPEQLWKSVFQVKFNPPMKTMAIHDNPDGSFRILAPRSYHGRLSLEIGHVRKLNWVYNDSWAQQRLVADNKLVTLYELYRRCSKWP